MSAAHKDECPVSAGQVVKQNTGNNAYFTKVQGAWLAIVSVAQSLAIDGLMLATSVPLLAVLVAVLGAPK